MFKISDSELQKLNEVAEDLAQKSIDIPLMLRQADIPTNSCKALEEYLSEAHNALNTILQDIEREASDRKYFGDYKGTISDTDLYIEVKDIEPDEDGDTYYYGTQSVYVNGKSFSRDFICERRQFQDAVDTEIYKRIE